MSAQITVAHSSPPRAVEARASPTIPAPLGGGIGTREAGQYGSRPAGSTAAPGSPTTRAAGGPDQVRQAASRAAEALFGGRDVSVESFYDEGSGRAVYRVADRVTGEILVETPPEELLRFFASARERPGSPLVALEA